MRITCNTVAKKQTNKKIIPISNQNKINSKIYFEKARNHQIKTKTFQPLRKRTGLLQASAIYAISKNDLSTADISPSKLV